MIRAKIFVAALLCSLIAMSYTCRIYATERWDLLTIESIQCVKPAGGVDGWITDGLSALTGVAKVTKVVGLAIGEPTVAAIADEAAKGSSQAKEALEFLNGNFSGQDDLIVQVNGKRVLPTTGDYHAMNAGQTINPHIQVSFRDKVRISLIEYDSGSDNDDLGNVTIDSSWLKANDVHQWKQLIVLAPSSEDGSVYYITAKVDAGKGNPNSVPQWVKCGTAQCVACPQAQCAERDHSELDRDGDEEDLKDCPPGYTHFAYQKYPQFLVEDVYLRICRINQTEPPAVGQPNRIQAKGNAAKCFHKQEGGWANGNNIHLWDCSAGGEEMKTWVYDASTGYIKAQSDPSKCFHKQAGGWANGNNIHLWDCSAGGEEMKTWVYDANTGYIKARSNPSKCFHKQAGGWANGNNIHLWDCSAGGEEMKTWVIAQSTVKHPNRIQAKGNSAKCFHKQAGGWANGNNIHLWDCSAGGEEMKTWVYDASTGYIKAQSNPSKCFHKQAGGWANGNNIHLWDCSAGGEEMKTWVYDANTGYIKARSNPSKCFHKQAGGWANGNNIHLWDCSAGGEEMKTWVIAQ